MHGRALVLLHLVYVVSSLSPQSSNSLPSSRDSSSIIRPSVSSLPVETTRNLSTERGGDLFQDIIGYQREKKPQKRKRSNQVAPAVDSTLLRFLSAQKADSISSVSAIGASTESWLGQFNSNRVSNFLLTCGVVDEALARRAGEAVQTHVLARTARRRIRDFLKNRDSEWVNGNEAYPIDSNQLLPEYGLEDTIKIMMEFGLSGSDIATILSHTPSIALMMPRRDPKEELNSESGGETLEETLLRAFDGLLLSTLNLRRYDARKVLRSCPGLLTMKGSKRAESVVTLMTSLGVSLSALGRDKIALPILLQRSPSAIFRLVSFLASDAVRMKVKSIGPLLRRRESAEILDLVAPIPTIDAGLNVTISDRISSDVWSENARNRRYQMNDLYREMSKTAWTLRNQIGTADLGKVIAAYPSVLLHDTEFEILPIAEYLMDDLGIFKDDLPKVLQLYPMLLGRELTEMKRTVAYLTDLGVEEEALPSIFRAFPALLTMDIENTMQPVVDFFREIGILNIGRFITRLPPVLGYSVERELRPKWEYLSRVCLYPSFELSAFPAYFSYPLDRVIKTRYEYLQFVKKSPTQLLALDLVVRYGDKDFAERVAKDTDGGVAFSKFAKIRREARMKKSV